MHNYRNNCNLHPLTTKVHTHNCYWLNFGWKQQQYCCHKETSTEPDIHTCKEFTHKHKISWWYFVIYCYFSSRTNTGSDFNTISEPITDFRTCARFGYVSVAIVMVAYCNFYNEIMR